MNPTHYDVAELPSRDNYGVTAIDPEELETLERRRQIVKPSLLCPRCGARMWAAQSMGKPDGYKCLSCGAHAPEPHTPFQYRPVRAEHTQVVQCRGYRAVCHEMIEVHPNNRIRLCPSCAKLRSNERQHRYRQKWGAAYVDAAAMLKARQAKGMTQRQLSELVFHAHTWVGKVEIRALPVKPDMQERIANALGITVEQLMGVKG